MQPDITAPGLNILAAWTPASSATGLPFDNRIVQYNLESGTSMSCPHAAGVGTLLRAKYPNWSPAAIRSAIMTTATQHDNSGQLIRDASAVTATPFNYGAGQINPNAAAHPGLIYDASIYDFKLFLCGLGYNTSSILVLTGETFECPETIPAAVDLNYPSIALSALKGKTVVTRAVTNVGSAKSVYRVAINAPAGIRVSIAPPKLKFKQKGETLSFQVTFTATNVTGEYAFGSYTWTDGHHNVRSPFAVKAV
jgi:subtilisin family serine protease